MTAALWGTTTIFTRVTCMLSESWLEYPRIFCRNATDHCSCTDAGTQAFAMPRFGDMLPCKRSMLFLLTVRQVALPDVFRWCKQAYQKCGAQELHDTMPDKTTSSCVKYNVPVSAESVAVL